MSMALVDYDDWCWLQAEGLQDGQEIECNQCPHWLSPFSCSVCHDRRVIIWRSGETYPQQVFSKKSYLKQMLDDLRAFSLTKNIDLDAAASAFGVYLVDDDESPRINEFSIFGEYFEDDEFFIDDEDEEDF